MIGHARSKGFASPQVIARDPIKTSGRTGAPNLAQDWNECAFLPN
jgi:hypothetical protein